MKTKNVALIAMMTAIIIVLGFVPPIPLGFIPVPIVLQNMGIMLAGAILGAFTEYGSIVGGKMLFENKSFLQANKDISWVEAASIGVAAGFGAISGVAKFATWAGSSTGRKILVKMLEVGLGAAEDVIKQAVNLKEGESIDLTQTLISSLTDLGMGHILKGTSLEKYITKQEKRIAKAEIKISAITSSGVGTAKGQEKKIRTQVGIIKNATEKKKSYEKIRDVFNKTATSGASTVTTGIYEENKNK